LPAHYIAKETQLSEYLKHSIYVNAQNSLLQKMT